MAKYGEIEYRYDASGIRQEKQIGNVLHKYYTDGSRIYKEERGNEVLWYHYDNTGVTGLEHNGKKYYFQKNIQGDVVRIFDEAGSLKASYIYDAWGNHRVIDGMTGMDVTHDFTIGGVTTDVSRHIGNINPFRYRGYYFDRETGLYYLNSRYYDPAICRFINADDARVSEQYVYTLNGLNLYSYCLNNPITHTDENGHVIGWIIGIALALGGLLLSADALIKAISAYQRNSTGANLFQLIVSSIFFVIDLVLFIFSVIKLVQAIKAAKYFVSATQAIQGADDAVVNSVDDILSKDDIARLRQQAVRKAWAQERELVMTGKSTRSWTVSQRQELLKTGRVKGFQGHHMTSVKASIQSGNIGLISDPNNIMFLSRTEHIAHHIGGFRTGLTTDAGTLIDRIALLALGG